MALRSMTGFYRADGSLNGATWHWEIRSVNGRGLDLRLRLPPGHESIEPRAREALIRRLSRGNVTANLMLQKQAVAVEIRLNEQALGQVIKAAKRLEELMGASPPSSGDLLAIRGVLEVAEQQETETDMAERSEAMLASLDVALDGMIAARAGEGDKLHAIVSDQVDRIATLVAAIESSPVRRPEAVTQRLRDLIARVVDTGSGLDPVRVHQEAVLLVARADVEEELKRLGAHVSAARGLLAEQGPVGRKLDFLAQEFNREANTLCSKSSDSEVTHLGLELKTVIDQMREQVQNVE